MQKLKNLHAKRTESRQINHSEVIEEDRRAKEPKNMEARKRRAEYLLQEEEFKRKCEAEGKDFEREKMRRKGADEVSRDLYKYLGSNQKTASYFFPTLHS